MTAIPLETLVTVFGGSGFLGRHVVRALAELGYRVRVAVRRPELAGFLQPLGRVGQIHAVPANVRNPNSVEAAARDAHDAWSRTRTFSPRSLTKTEWRYLRQEAHIRSRSRRATQAPQFVLDK